MFYILLSYDLPSSQMIPTMFKPRELNIFLHGNGPLHLVAYHMPFTPELPGKLEKRNPVETSFIEVIFQSGLLRLDT